MTSQQEVYDAMRLIIKDQDAPALNYAVNYAKHALTCASPYALVTQCIYTLNNITRWRHPSAPHVRQTLKQYVKENQAQ